MIEEYGGRWRLLEYGYYILVAFTFRLIGQQYGAAYGPSRFERDWRLLVVENTEPRFVNIENLELRIHNC